eukprot:11311658-Ditylum_brightwellii.AAC.1
MQKIVKCKPMDTVEVACTSKKSDNLDNASLGMCNPSFAICLQDLKKHYFPKNTSCLQKVYFCNYIKKPNKLSIKNTTARICNVNSMLTKFLSSRNTPMFDDELCNICTEWSNMIGMILSVSQEETPEI